jgi:hypothetical protein
MKSFYELYSKDNGLDALCEARVTQAPGKYVLLKGIVPQDQASKIVSLNDGNVKHAIAFEISSCGDEVPASLKVGMHCIHISAAGDPVQHGSDTARYMVVHHEDICLAWEPDEAAEILDHGEDEA